MLLLCVYGRRLRNTGRILLNELSQKKTGAKKIKRPEKIKQGQTGSSKKHFLYADTYDYPPACEFAKYVKIL